MRRRQSLSQDPTTVAAMVDPMVERRSEPVSCITSSLAFTSVEADEGVPARES